MTLQSGFVHIIESPSSTDLLDGRTEGKALGEILRLAGIRYYYNLATTQETFKAALYTRFKEALEECDLPPILHLSMHGNKEGIALTDGDFLSWVELQALLTPLTKAIPGGLLICMSSCFGSSGSQMAMYEDAEYPFSALVGNNGSVFWHDAAVAYITFYHLLFKGIPIKECVERMKLASADSNFSVRLGHEVKANWIEYTAQFRRESQREVLQRVGQEVLRMARQQARQRVGLSDQNQP